jgi:hypothetical protein
VTSVPLSNRREGYNLTMRYYTIRTTPERTIFKCSVCSYSVATVDFNIQGGHLRTQAAKALNEHAAAKHAGQTSGVGHPQPSRLGVSAHVQDTAKRMAYDPLRQGTLV